MYVGLLLYSRLCGAVSVKVTPPNHPLLTETFLRRSLAFGVADRDVRSVMSAYGPGADVN